MSVWKALGVLVLILSQCFAEAPGDLVSHPRWNPSVPSLGSKNLLPNASFELGRAGWSSLGQTTGWGGDLCGLYGEIQKGGGCDGAHGLRIELGPGKTPVTFFDVWPPSRVVQAAPLAANLGWLQVTPGRSYNLSVHMRADRDGVPAKLVFRYGTSPSPWPWPSERAKSVALTREWTRYSFTHLAEESDLFIAVGPDLSATPDASASVWIDAVQVEEGDEATAFVPREPVEMGWETGRVGNVFRPDEPVKLKVFGSNVTEEDAIIRVSVQLKDFFGREIPTASERLKIPAHKTACTSLALPVPGTGAFRGKIAWERKGDRREQILKVAVIEPYPHDDSPFGINHAPTTPEQCGLLRRAGVLWARDWSANWEFVEPKPGQVSFEVPDQQIGRVLASGMKVLCLLPANPSTNWESEAPPDVAASMWRRMAYAPKDPLRLNDFIHQAVMRYKDRVHAWEFLNEPLWVPDFCLPQSAGYTVATYSRLLQGACEAMKSADPDCQVVAGLSIETGMPLGDDFLRAGGLEKADVYNLHPYPDPGTSPPEDQIEPLQRIARLMESEGIRKQIWATETGYYATDDKPWTPWESPAGHHAGLIQLQDERQAVDFLIRHALILLAHGVEKIFFHQGIEGEVNNGSWSMDNPLLGPEAVPTPFYSALSVLANLLGPKPGAFMPWAKPETADGRSTRPVYGYAFEAQGRAVMSAWATTPGWALVFSKSDAKAEDLMGRPLSGPRLELGSSPVYVVSESLSAKELASACRLEANP